MRKGTTGNTPFLSDISGPLHRGPGLDQPSNYVEEGDWWYSSDHSSIGIRRGNVTNEMRALDESGRKHRKRNRITISTNKHKSEQVKWYWYSLW
jgi:hypothetical protein